MNNLENNETVDIKLGSKHTLFSLLRDGIEQSIENDILNSNGFSA